MLIGPSFDSFTQQEWFEYVKGLRITAPSNASKSVPDVQISFGQKVVVRVKRMPKQISEVELALLAAEYQKPVEELRELVTKRKVMILNELGEQTNVRQPKPKSGRPKKASKRKKDAGDKTNSGDDSGVHQL